MSRIIIINSNKVQKSLETRDILHKKLIDAGFDVCYEYNPDAELIISIGGDGCFLQTVHELLKAETNLPIEFWDERLSTVAAERSLIEGDVSRQKRKKVIDMLAAVIILQGYLDLQRNF